MALDKLKIFYLYIFILYKYINCKEFYIENMYKTKNNNTISYSSMTPNSFLFKDFNDKIVDDFENIMVISRTIIKGKVQTEFLDGTYIYIFNFSDINNESDLIVNLYSLDCQIKIADDENGIIVKNISNYEYDAFSIVVPKDKINSSFIRVKPLINPLEEKNKKRTYHLIINSFDKDNPQLMFTEKFPTLIYFDSKIETIKFFYELNNSEEPVVFSFFIIVRAKFEVQIIDSEIPNRIIAYKDNIIIDPKYIYTNNSIYISLNKEDNKNSTMIVKVSGNNSPFYLQKNLLNLGFMPINTHNHYYYMDIFKGEEGEVMLNNKIHNGYLLNKIINKTIADEREILNNYMNYFPNPDDYKELYKYNDFSKKLDLYSDETENCENGCYLLITYYSPEINIKYLDGIEYTLLARIWDEVEFKSQIVNIPLNEYVFGAIEPKSSSINAHYYSVFIPENDVILFEFQGRNIQTFVKKGIIQINFIKRPYNSFPLIDFINNKDIEDEKLIIELYNNNVELESFENQYLSFVFIIKLDDDYLNSLINFYYFRIIQNSSKNDYIIYPLDINKANLCQTNYEDKNYVCYFLLKNDYKELYNHFSIFAYGTEQAINYNIWAINETDYYSIDINNIKEKYIYQSRNRTGFLRLNLNETSNYALLEIFSNYQEILQVLFNYDSEFIPSPSLDIYSYQSFYLKTNFKKDFYFYFDYGSEVKYTVIINNTIGNGYIYFNNNSNDNDKKKAMSENTLLSFTLSEEMKSIHIFSENNLFFYMKIKNKKSNDVMEELDFGHNYKNITKIYKYSKAYYIKDIFSNGVDISFTFNFKNTSYNNRKITIYGYIANYDDIKYVDSYESLEKKLDNTYINNIRFFKGLYDDLIQIGFISFDNDLAKNESNKEYKYYLITFENYTDVFSEFSADIFIDSKKESKCFLEKNKYIRGGFNLNDMIIQNKTFFIDFKGDKNKNVKNDYVLEFSSNINDIIPIFNNEFKSYSQKNNREIQKYYFSKDNLQEGKKYNFTIQLNRTNKTNNHDDIFDKYRNLILTNYLFKFYIEENVKNIDFMANKNIEIKRIGDSFGLKIKYNFTIKNSQKSNLNLNEDFKYIYSINICYKSSFNGFQILNSTAINDCNLNRCLHETSDPNEEFSCSFDLNDNQNYISYLFMIVKYKNEEESYFSIYKDFITKKEEEKKNDNNENNEKLIIILVIVGLISILIIIISSIVCIKNENLKEEIQKISFNKGIDENELKSSDLGKDIIFI